MDNFPSDPQAVDNSSWATPVSAVIALAIGGFALVTASLLTHTDPAGRFLISLAALGLWIIAGLAAYQRPRLSVEGGSLSMKRLTGVQTYRRGEITRIKLIRYPRLGRRTPMLEIDVQRAGDDVERLIVLGRWDLGTDPHDVYDALVRHGLVPPER